MNSRTKASKVYCVGKTVSIYRLRSAFSDMVTIYTMGSSTHHCEQRKEDIGEDELDDFDGRDLLPPLADGRLLLFRGGIGKARIGDNGSIHALLSSSLKARVFLSWKILKIATRMNRMSEIAAPKLYLLLLMVILKSQVMRISVLPAL